MKLFAKTLLPLFLFGAGSANAQQNSISQVKHVIIVIQENRTPDNLFHDDNNLYNNGGRVRSLGSPVCTPA